MCHKKKKKLKRKRKAVFSLSHSSFFLFLRLVFFFFSNFLIFAFSFDVYSWCRRRLASTPSRRSTLWLSLSLSLFYLNSDSEHRCVSSFSDSTLFPRFWIPVKVNLRSFSCHRVRPFSWPLACHLNFTECQRKKEKRTRVEFCLYFSPSSSTSFSTLHFVKAGGKGKRKGTFTSQLSLLMTCCCCYCYWSYESFHYEPVTVTIAMCYTWEWIRGPKCK